MRTLLRSISGITVALIVFLVAASACTADTPPSGIFTDDDSTLHEPNIESLAVAGITNGCNPPSNNLYCPHQPVTRGQMAAFLARALSLTDDSGGNWFTDDNNSIFESSIDNLASAGITRGCNPPVNDQYCPNQPVTRGQMAVFLTRALNLTNNGDRDWFTDDNGSIVEDSVNKLAAAGITAGCNPPTNDRYCPDAAVTRAQMASFIVRALSLPPADMQRFGPGVFINDNNLNLPLRLHPSGPTMQVVHQSFRAPKDGDLTGVRAYLRTGSSGYAAGTGGTIEVNVWPAEGDPLRPIRTGEPLATGRYQMALSGGGLVGLAESWPLIQLTARQSLQAGALYVVEFKNVDPDPASNWVSINVIGAMPEHETVARYLPIEDWSVIYEWAADGSTNWLDLSRELHSALTPMLHFPSAEYMYADGTVFGHVRLEPGNFDSTLRLVDSSHPIRERFNIQEAGTIWGAEIHTATKVAGDLQVLFKLNGETVGTATLSEPSATFRTSGLYDHGVFDWHNLSVAEFDVAPGDILDVEMVAVGPAVWAMSADRSGLHTEVPFSPVTTDGDSSAQVWTGSEWVNTLYFDHESGAHPFGTSHFRVVLMATAP